MMQIIRKKLKNISIKLDSLLSLGDQILQNNIVNIGNANTILLSAIELDNGALLGTNMSCKKNIKTLNMYKK